MRGMNTRRTAQLQQWGQGLPHFDDEWESLCRDHGSEADLSECAAFMHFARLVVGWYRAGDRVAVAHAFAQTEELVAVAEYYSDHELRHVIAVCFLESVQNLALDSPADYAGIEAMLGPLTRECWIEIERFWEGEGMVGPHLLPAAVAGLKLIAWFLGYGVQHVAVIPWRWCRKERDE